jgi:hypothetical protein
MEKYDLNSKVEGFCTAEEFPLKRYNCSGIYFVFSGYYSENEKLELTKFLYIGESENVVERFKGGHETYSKWKRELEKDESLFYTFIAVDPDIRENCEKFFIYKFKPCCNEKDKDNFDESKMPKIDPRIFIKNKPFVEFILKNYNHEY